VSRPGEVLCRQKPIGAGRALGKLWSGVRSTHDECSRSSASCAYLFRW